MKTNYIIKHFAGTFIFFLILFFSAGKIDYWQGLIYVFIGLIMAILNYTILKPDSELLMERSKPGEGSKKWDKAFLTISGQLLFLLAQKQNKFFSSTVRIQSERNHTVCDTGLYKIVRHPAYLGSIIQSIGFPLLFGSLWSIIPVAFMIILQITRTYWEDKTLTKELIGYSEYSLKTRYKILPFIW
jgi:steroid 5-alpha reductase family enzyme